MAHTQHSERRMQQRSIPPFVIDLLDQFGSSMRCGGAERIFFDKTARRRLKTHLGGTRGLHAIENWPDVYAVVGDNGQVVTVAHQQNRFRRP